MEMGTDAEELLDVDAGSGMVTDGQLPTADEDEVVNDGEGE
jgi:hypothetical protein